VSKQEDAAQLVNQVVEHRLQQIKRLGDAAEALRQLAALTELLSPMGRVREREDVAQLNNQLVNRRLEELKQLADAVQALRQLIALEALLTPTGQKLPPHAKDVEQPLLGRIKVSPLTEQHAKELRALLDYYMTGGRKSEAESVEGKLLELVELAADARTKQGVPTFDELVQIIGQIPDTEKGRELRRKLRKPRLLAPQKEP